MSEVYTMVPAKSSTKQLLKERLKELTIERNGERTTYDDLLLELMKK